MAIGFVQSIGFSVGSSNGTTATLNGVADGNFLTTSQGVFISGNPSNVTPSDDKSNAWNTTTAPAPHDTTNCFINYAMDVAAGDTVVTIDYGTNFATDGEFAEFSGIELASALDVEDENDSAGDSTPDITSAGTTAQAVELVLAVLATGNAGNPAGIDTPATTGYTNLHAQDNNVNNVGSASDYKIVAATGTQSAAWGTLAAASSWSAKIATFKGAAASAAITGTAGGTSRYKRPLPQYYSRRFFGKDIQLPQEPQAHEVAVNVLDQAAELLEGRDDFAAMLAEADQLRRIVAIHIESRGVYDAIEEVKARIQARRDAEIAEHMQTVVEKAELDELMEIL